MVFTALLPLSIMYFKAYIKKLISFLQSRLVELINLEDQMLH